MQRLVLSRSYSYICIPGTQSLYPCCLRLDASHAPGSPLKLCLIKLALGWAEAKCYAGTTSASASLALEIKVSWMLIRAMLRAACSSFA